MTDPPTVQPVLDARVRGLCRRPYAGHPKGCPNWDHLEICPPQAPKLGTVLNLAMPVYCAHNAFDLAGHVSRMRSRHPKWSERQLFCCLYWQRTARKQLRIRVNRFLRERPDLAALYCPEACGVNVTATMLAIGIVLEWPPRSTAYQVALIGTPRGD